MKMCIFRRISYKGFKKAILNLSISQHNIIRNYQIHIIYIMAFASILSFSSRTKSHSALSYQSKFVGLIIYQIFSNPFKYKIPIMS